MWNAYTTTNPALPNRDIRVRDITVDGSINYSDYITDTVSITQENGVSSNYQIAALKVGDYINIYFPLIQSTTSVFTSAFKTLTIPSSLRPVTSGLCQPVCTNVNGAENIGSARFNSVSELRIYTLPTLAQPTYGNLSICQPFVLSYLLL